MRYVTGPVTKLSVQDVNRINYGYPYFSTSYLRGSYVSAPAAGSRLNSYDVPLNYRGSVIAILIDATEGNYFDVAWTSGGKAYTYRIRIPADGVMSYDFRPGLNLDLPADPGSTISVNVVNAGSTGSAYKVDLLVGIW